MHQSDSSKTLNLEQILLLQNLIYQITFQLNGAGSQAEENLLTKLDRAKSGEQERVDFLSKIFNQFSASKDSTPGDNYMTPEQWVDINNYFNVLTEQMMVEHTKISELSL